MRFPHNEALALHQVRDGRRDSRVTAGTRAPVCYAYGRDHAIARTPQGVRGHGTFVTAVLNRNAGGVA